MFYFLIIPGLVISLGMLLHFRRIEKHDKVLYRFCQVRRDIMTILRRDLLEVNREKYFGLRVLLDGTSNAIHYYNDNKTTLFNFREFCKWLGDAKRSAEAMEKLKLPNDPEVLEIRDRFAQAMVCGFCAYTPFLRTEAGFAVSLFLLKAMAKAGWRRAETLIQSANWFKNFRSTSHGSGEALCPR